MKCQICKQEEREYIWHPQLNHNGEFIFYFPGRHIRGFMAIGVGDKCIEKIQSGETMEFTYKKHYLVKAGSKEFSWQDTRMEDSNEE